PMVKGEKTPTERFAGAVRTFTIEGMMRDGKALQSGTSHYLGTNFARAFDITYQDRDNQLQHVHTTSWGMSTRMIGAVILAHGDDQGLVLPPRLAPVQVAIVPIGRGEQAEAVLDKAYELRDQLKAAGVRVQVDDRDASPGFRFNDLELKGVPLRVELGPRDLEAGQVLVATRVGERDAKGRPVKDTVTFDDFLATIHERLDAYHDLLVDRARDYLAEHSGHADDLETFAAQVKHGFSYVLHCGSTECEDELKAATAATPRCIPTDGEPEEGPCVRCGQPSAYGTRVVFARAY
ncbi:MAG: proline--tRNA ligase, partial [Nitriliruptoraceae bacterium]